MKIFHQALSFATFLQSLQTITASPAASNGAAPELVSPFHNQAAAFYEAPGQHWTTNVTIGNQVFNLLIDTGSADLWVYGKNVTNPGSHKVYDYTKSPQSGLVDSGPPGPSNERTPETFSIAYAFDGSGVSGFAVHDTVSIGGSPPVQMVVEVADHVEDTMKNITGMDGIIGLGWENSNFVSPEKVPPFMQRLLGAMPSILPVFTVDLDPQRPGSSRTIEIGKIDHSKANGDLQRAPVNNGSGFWQVDNITYEVAGKRVPGNHSMILDTGGSSAVNVDRNVADVYYANVKGHKGPDDSGYYMFPCQSELPDLTLNMGNGTAIYRASLLGGSNSTGTCWGTITANNKTYGNVGAAFFKGHYVVFNYNEPSIEYAPRL